MKPYRFIRPPFSLRKAKLDNLAPVPASLHPYKRERNKVAFALLGAALALGAVLRAFLALTDDGIYWPDEIYQSLEPAHRVAFGYGLKAWEFIDGARNWTFPGLVAILLKVADLIGLDHPRQYLSLVRLAFAGVGVATAYGVFRLARSQGASETAAACGAALFSLAAPALYFAPRAMAETASGLPAALGLALVLPEEATRRQRLWGGALLSLSVLIRLQCAVLCACAVLILLGRPAWRAFLAWRRHRGSGLAAVRAERWRPALELVAALAAGAAFYGLLDLATWGGLFHSALFYLRFNLVEGRASEWGTAPWHYYFRTLFTSMPSVALALLPLCLLSARRAPGLFFATAAFLVLHATIPHKELRFILPALPLLCGLAAVGLSALPGRLRPLGVGAVLFGSLFSIFSYANLTFGELGQYEDQRPSQSAFDDFGAVNRLLIAAHDRSDLCGLRVDVALLVLTGGSTYLHRPVPIYSGGWPAPESQHFNYVIAFAGTPGEVVATQANLVLVRMGSTCVADPGYSWRL